MIKPWMRDRGDKAAAVEMLKEAVALDPAFAFGHGLLAKLYVDLAESDLAIAHALKVVELEPKDSFSYTALSVVYQRCGKIPEAEDANTGPSDPVRPRMIIPPRKTTPPLDFLVE